MAMKEKSGTFRFPDLFGRAVARVERRGKSLHEDILLLAGVILLCAFYYAEGYRLDFSTKDPAQIYQIVQKFPSFLQEYATMFFVLGMELVCRALTVLMLAVLACLGFSNGLRRKPGFLIFTAAYFLAPQLYLLGYRHFSPSGKLLRCLDQLAQVLIDWPFRALCQWQQYGPGLSQGMLTNLTLLLVILTFALGFAAKQAQVRFARPGEH